MKKIAASLLVGLVCLTQARGEAMLQLFNLTWNQISDKMPELAEAGYTALWLPPPTKAGSQFSTGYDCFDPFDLGDKNQSGTIATHYGTKDELLRMVRIAHRFGIRVYFDNIMNHRTFSTPGYDANTPINLFPGLLPEDFHLQTTGDGFYRKTRSINWGDSADYNDTWRVQNLSESDLIDLSQENPNSNFGPTLGSTSSKLTFIRHPNNPEYYMDTTLPLIAGFWYPFNGTNGVPTAENTASYLIRAALWFINETKADGFRFDAVKHVPSSFFGDYGQATPYGYTGAIQTMFQNARGYVTSNGYNGQQATGSTNWNNRTACFDTEAIRNDALLFGEHLGEPPSFDEYTGRGMRLVDANLIGTLNNLYYNANSMSGLDQADSGGFNHFNRVMYVQSHDNDFYPPLNWRPIFLSYIFSREGIASIYSDGYFQSAYCQQCGGAAFPRIANAPYLGEYGDNTMPELVTVREQVARGGTRPRWSDQNVVAFERYEYREPNLGDAYNNVFATTLLFAMNDNIYADHGDINFDDGAVQNDSGMPSTCYSGTANSRHVGLVVSFPPGSVLRQLAASAPGADRACPYLLVRNVTLNLAAAQASINASNPVDRLVYVGGQFVPPGGGAVEFCIPSGGYVMYGYQGPEASRAGLKDAITIRQNGQDAPRMTVLRSTGRDGDQNYNPIFPFKMRGSTDQLGNVIGGVHTGSLTYAIDIPVITNTGPIEIIVRSDASTANTLVKFDGGMDINSQMGTGPIWTNATTGVIDRRDNRPGFTYDMLLGYEQTTNLFRYGPEKFAATNITRNVVVSLGAETYAYTIGGSSSVALGNGPNVNTSTANWVYHNPLDTTDQSLLMRSSTGAGQAVTNWVKVGYQFNITTGNIYYTTDGTAPEGSFGTAKKGTATQVLPLNFSHTSSGGDGTYDWWFGVVPAQASGTVTYKIAVYKGNVTTPISDGNYSFNNGSTLFSKWYGLAQFAITNFNPQTAKVWVHDDLNTNSTITGLEPGFHIIRARTFLQRTNQSSVLNTFAQTFYYDPALPQGAIAFPRASDTIASPQYGAVIRADSNATGVDYSITDANNPGGTPFQPATQVSANPDVSQEYPNYPNEYRFNYTAVPSSGNATITVHIKDATSTAFSNRYTTITRTVPTVAPPVGLNIAFPEFDGKTINLDQNSAYQIVVCASNALANDLSKFTFLIDGAVQPISQAFLTNNNYCSPGFDVRFNWSGMGPGFHSITCLYSNQSDGYVLQASRFVTNFLTGVSVNILNPPAADAKGHSPYTITLPQNCLLTPTNNFTITVSTSTNATGLNISFVPATNAFAGGSAILDTNFVSSTTKQWNFLWTNLVAGTFTIRADALGGGSNTGFRTVNFVAQQFAPTNPNSDDSDNDGLSDLIETQVQTNQLNKAEDNYVNSDVHLKFISGKTDPNNPDTDSDGLPDGLELGVGPLPAATNTDVNADTNCDGVKNFIPDEDSPLYNTLDNKNRPAGYDGFDPWPDVQNGGKPRTDLIAGTVTNPNNSDTDFDSLNDGIEDMNHNGRVDITVTNASGAPLTSTNGIAGTTYASVTLSNANGQLVVTGRGFTWTYPNLAGQSIPNGSSIATNIVVIAHPPAKYNTSTIDRDKVLSHWANALWLETDPNNADADGDGLTDGSENASRTGFMKIGLLDRSVGYSSGSGTVTGILAAPYPPSILYFPGTSRVNRKALIQQYPNAVLLETDPMDDHTDGDPNGLKDGWKAQYGLDPWDDGVIGHTNWHTGALITSMTNGALGVLCSCCPTNFVAQQNKLDPRQCYTNGAPVVTNSITIGAGATIGTTAGNTWFTELQGWSADDLKVVRPYDGIGPNSQGHTVYPCPNGCDGFDWSRDIVAFYAHDGGADGNYYFRADVHDLTFGADQNSRVSLYVAINVGSPGTGETTLPESIGATTDMGWNVLAGIYGKVGSAYAANLYVKKTTDVGQSVYHTYAYQQPGGVQNQYWRADLDSIEFSIPRSALIDAGWSGFTPLNFQVFTTAGGFRFGWRPAIVGTVYDGGIAEYQNTGYGSALHYWFTSINQNAVNLSSYAASANVTSRPNIAKVAIVLHGNQSILPASIIQGLVSNAVTRTPSNSNGNASYDATYNPGNNPVGYHRALESAQVFGVPLNLHLSGSLISALQWAKSEPSLNPTGSRDGAKFNQRIASMISSGRVMLIGGMFADHIAPYFTGAVNRAGIQLQDDIMRSVYGSNSVTPSTPIWLAEQAADGRTMSDLALNSGHNYTILNQMTHLWFWGDQIYGAGNGRLTALQNGGYQINKFNGMKTFLISGASDQMYLNNDLGTSIVLRELLIRKALDSTRDQIVILADNWETAAGVGGNSNPDNLNLNLRWMANHQWIKAVKLSDFGDAKIDINNDGVTNSNPNIFACIDPTADNPCVNDRGTFNFNMQAKDFVRHASETNYNNWYYGSAQEESFYSKKPPIRTSPTNTYTGKIMGHVLTNGTILADSWTDVQASAGALSNLAKLVYLSGIFETAFHSEDNTDISRFSTGDYKNPDTTFDSLAAFAYIPNSHISRQASIVAAASAWATSSPSSTPVATTQDVDQDGENEYILSNDRLYAIFERLGGRLIAAFARDPVTGNAYQTVGNLVSTPDFEDESEGSANLTGSAPLAYRCSGFKDWFAVTNANGTGTSQYVNDLNTVTTLGSGFRFASSDGKIVKTITLAGGDNKVEANYQLTGIVTLYTRHGLSPDALALLYFGQAGLTGPSNATGKVSIRNLSAFSDTTAALAFANAGHSNCNYNASANDNNGNAAFVNVSMRNLAQTQQIELQGSNTFSFAMQLTAIERGPTVDHVGDGIPDAWRQQYFSDIDPTGLTTNSQSCAACDPDGDGMTNIREYIAGTHPKDGSSYLHIISITRSGGGYLITWTSVTGRQYNVYAAADLATGFSATPLNVSPITAGGSTTSYPDAPAPGTRKYYKVKVLP